MRQFPLAPHPEIMRAEQRDEEYTTDLCKRCDDVLWSCLGARWAIPYQHEIKLAGQALYYFLTTGMGIQTLGEEYSHITQVAGQSGLPLSPARRTFLVFVQILPSLAERLSSRAAARGMLLNSQNSQSAGMRENSSSYNGSCQSFLLQQWALILPSIREALLLLGRANLMLFYFRGLYYTVAKRMANVRYAYMGKLPQQRTRYHLLGVFLLIQVCITGSKWFKQNIMPAIVTTSGQGDLSRQPATLKDESYEVHVTHMRIHGSIVTCESFPCNAVNNCKLTGTNVYFQITISEASSKSALGVSRFYVPYRSS